MMALKGFIAVVTASIICASAPAFAQSSGVPAEFPPADFDGNQYVDSEGCAFIRAGIGGVTNWVPRVNRSRQQLCGFQPTFGTAEPDPAPGTAPQPDMMVAAPPAPAPAAPAPTENVATAPAPLTIETPAAPAPASPRIVAPAAAPEPAAVPEPPRVTLAEACDGRFGVQPGFISARTGAPIDCGPAPVAAPVMAAPAPQEDPTPRLTLAEVCARAADNPNVRYVDAATGEPIACAAAPTVAAAPAPVIAPNPSAPAAAPCRATRTFNGLPVDCAPQVTRRATAPLFDTGANATLRTNPAIADRAAPPPPAGFERVWNDGRINPQRGLPAQRLAKPSAKPQSAPPQVSAPAAAASHRFVQVALFADHANADRLIQRLGAQGMPVSSGLSGGMKVVAAGPFSDAASLRRALGIVRGMGFADAYPRN